MREPPSAIGHEWANDPEHVASVTVARVDVARRGGRARERGDVAGSPRRSSPRTRPRRERFLDALSRHRRVLERADALHRRVRADRLARDGHQRRPRPGPARAGHVPRSLAPPVPRRRRRNAAPVKRPLVVKLGSSLVVDERGRPRRDAASRARGRDRGDRRRRHAGLHRLVRRDRARPARGSSLRAAADEPAAAPGRVRARPGARSSARGRTRSAPHGLDAAQILLTARRDRRAARVRQRAQRARCALRARRACRS